MTTTLTDNEALAIEANIDIYEIVAECAGNGEIVATETFVCRDGTQVTNETFLMQVDHSIGLGNDKCAWIIYELDNDGNTDFASLLGEGRVNAVRLGMDHDTWTVRETKTPKGRVVRTFIHRESGTKFRSKKEALRNY